MHKNGNVAITVCVMRVNVQIHRVFSYVSLLVRSLFVKVVPRVDETPLWNTPANPPDPPDPPDPPNRCHELRLGPYLPRAPGARMTVVKQTPSNEWFIKSQFIKHALGG